MVNVCPFDVPPPGVGLKTVTGKLPAVSRSPAGIAALSCVELMNVVVRALLLKLTTEPDMKPEPFTVRVRPAPPAVLDVVRARTPTGRLVTMADIVHAVAFLLENRSVNAHNLAVDGGTLLR